MRRGGERRGETDMMINILGRLYLCLVLGLGPGVGRGVLTWLMSSILARGARGLLLDILRTSFTFTRDVR